MLLRKFGLHALAPQPGLTSFLEWWKRAAEAVQGMVKKGLDFLIILGAWKIWNLCSRCVFDGETPSLSRILKQTDDERSLWELAGATGLSYLVASFVSLYLFLASVRSIFVFQSSTYLFSS
jgi:hypothetical protein